MPRADQPVSVHLAQDRRGLTGQTQGLEQGPAPLPYLRGGLAVASEIEIRPAGPLPGREGVGQPPEPQ